MILSNCIRNIVLSFPLWGNRKGASLLCFLFFSFCYSKAQIANYVNNGGFENKINCNLPNALNKAIWWNCIDTSKFGGFLYAVNCYSNAPSNSIGFQFPRSGDTYFRLQAFCTNSCSYYNSRGYARNRLKSKLVANKTYCVKMHVSLQNSSPYAIDALGFYFGDNSIDTITYCYQPLTYLIPQIINPINNIISDTLNWVPITGTFVATGNEKFLVIGNYTSDAATTKTLVNSSSSGIWSEYFIDDVSCIDIDLPAYAGPDVYGIPNNTVYIGRPQDVGIDEACMWYKLPNLTTAIDTAAGITLTVGIVTNTYVVRQEICGNIKWDTVVVYPSGVGLNEGEYIKNSIFVYPNPANDVLNVSFNLQDKELFSKIRILNNLGQLVREEELKNNFINIKDLPNGVYMLKLLDSARSDNSESVSKRFVISR